MSKPVMPEVRERKHWVCTYRMVVDGIYFGFMDGYWQKADCQATAKRRFDKGVKV